MNWTHDDGGRAAAGYKGMAGDCVVRSIAIAARLSYREVYDGIRVQAKAERHSKRIRKSSPRNGVRPATTRKYLTKTGWTWVPTMHIGKGCAVHLKAGELPGGRLIVQLSKHVTAVVDGVIHDTFDPSRDGSRCVYGYYCQGGSETGEI